MNARSAVKKAALIHDVIEEHNLDLVFVEETWIPSDAPDAIKLDIAPTGYRVAHAHRGTSDEKRGGGIAVIYRESFQLSIVDVGKYDEFESLSVKITSSSSSHTIVCIYRPPGNVSGSFCEQFSDLLDRLLIDGKQYIICGDLNCPGYEDALIDHHLQDILTSYNQQQLVLGPTHDSNHTLDLLITPEHSNNWVSDVSIHSLCFTDHSLVRCRLGFTLRRSPTVTFSYRRIKRMDLNAFRRDIAQSPIFDPEVQGSSVDEYVNLFEKEVTRILDAHAPLLTRTRRQGSHDNRQLSPEARDAKCECRRLERRYRRTGSDVDKSAFVHARAEARDKIKSSRSRYLREKVATSADDPRTMWRTTRDLLHTSQSSGLDDGDCETMATTFSQFFSDKVARIKEAIRSTLSGMPLINLPPVDAVFSGMQLLDFGAVSVKEVKSLVNSMSNKSSPLDVLPTSLLKSCVDVFAPVIARIANLSFASGKFPSMFRIAQVLPLLKKQGLDHMSPGNYRPISNLNTISKIIERLVLGRLKQHIQESGSFDVLQSAYRTGHSTETALVSVLDNLFTTIDNKKITVLIGLDISAAFDTISHEILLQRMQRRFGVSGTALDWIESYLSERHQYVKLGRHRSSTVKCTSGVPQGSVLGPILFTLYTAPVADVITSRGVSYHQYADDTQLFYALSASEIDTSLTVVEECSRAVKRWFLENDLLLNAEKSEVMFVGTAAQLQKTDHVQSVNVADAVLPVSMKIKSLGVVLDRHLNFSDHVNTVARACNYHIWALRHIRHLLTEDIAHTLACSIVTSKLDYCNAVLHGAPRKNIAVLQRVQNNLARVVLQKPRTVHVTPLLQSLHWLPVDKRIRYKVVLLTYKVMVSKTPDYLSKLISERTSSASMSLRSSSRTLLRPKFTRTNYGDRAFSASAPAIWNELPADFNFSDSLNVFKKRLKTFLFNCAFN